MAQIHNGVHGTKRSRQDVGGAAGSKWVVKGSRESHDCVNPVRSCEEKYFRDAMDSRDKTKELIKLSIGEEIALL